MPAARQTDMCVCVGPPSSILMGCPTVMIGSGGGGGGGGGSSPAAKTAAAAEALKAGDVSPVEGTETFPIEIQAAFVEMNKYTQPEEIKLQIQVIAEALEKGRGAAREKEEPVKLTLADFVEILEAVESEESYEAARFFAAYLDYGKLTEMARDYVTGADDDANNDPNKMPTRFMILYGADDNKLQQIDDHPDAFEGEEHKINVTNLRKGLKLLGYEVAEEGPYDDEVYAALMRYISSKMKGMCKTEPTHIVHDGEDLGSIAKDYLLPSWKYLYEKNRELIGDNPSVLERGIELTIPQWDTTTGDEKIEAKGGKPFTYTNGLRYFYPWVPFEADIIEHSTGVPKEFEEKTSVKITNKDFSVTYAEMEIIRTDEIKLVLPDAPLVNIGIRTFPFSHGEFYHIHPDDAAAAQGEKKQWEENETSPKTEQELLDDLLA